jgi:hypothetical protein
VELGAPATGLLPSLTTADLSGDATALARMLHRMPALATLSVHTGRNGITHLPLAALPSLHALDLVGAQVTRSDLQAALLRSATLKRLAVTASTHRRLPQYHDEREGHDGGDGDGDEDDAEPDEEEEEAPPRAADVKPRGACDALAVGCPLTLTVCRQRTTCSRALSGRPPPSRICRSTRGTLTPKRCRAICSCAPRCVAFRRSTRPDTRCSSRRCL